MFKYIYIAILHRVEEISLGTTWGCGEKMESNMLSSLPCLWRLLKIIV